MSEPNPATSTPPRPRRVATLGDRRRAFTRFVCELVIWAEDTLHVRIAFDEVTVHSPRAARLGVKRVIVVDAVHKIGSFHGLGLAADLLVYPDLDGDGDMDDYLSDGSHPVWKLISRKWESYHPLCTAGIRWEDSNHMSFGEGSREGALP